MSEPLSREEVAKVASLAMLELSDDELDTFPAQLSAVLKHAEDVESLDVDDVVPTHHPFPLVNVFREDIVEPASDAMRTEALAAAPAVEDDQFKVPPALGEEM